MITKYLTKFLTRRPFANCQRVITFEANGIGGDLSGQFKVLRYRVSPRRMSAMTNIMDRRLKLKSNSANTIDALTALPVAFCCK
jgi:hypothetical protein